MTSSTRIYDEDQKNTIIVASLRTGATWFLVGGGIGAAIALLFAPKSGPELRSDLADLTRKGYGEILDLTKQQKVRLANVYGSIRGKADEIFDLAAANLSNGSQNFSDATDDGSAVGPNSEGTPQANKSFKTRASGIRASVIL